MTNSREKKKQNQFDGSEFFVSLSEMVIVFFVLEKKSENFATCVFSSSFLVI